MYNERQDFASHEAEVAEAVALLTRLGIVLSPHGQSLDLGGGPGMHCGFLQRTGQHVVCADILDYLSMYDGTFPQKIRDKYQRNGFELDLSRCAFVRSDAMNLVFRDGYFDSCFSFNAFEHIPDPELAFGEVARMLCPGGVAYISMDPIWTCDTGSHFFGRVPVPWHHLVVSAEEFRLAMSSAGASADELAEFPAAMNRKRLADYRAAMDRTLARYPVELLLHDDYSGLSDPAHAEHPNYRAAIDRGYSDEELRLRRLRWVLRKRA